MCLSMGCLRAHLFRKSRTDHFGVEVPGRGRLTVRVPLNAAYPDLSMNILLGTSELAPLKLQHRSPCSKTTARVQHNKTSIIQRKKMPAPKIQSVEEAEAFVAKVFDILDSYDYAQFSDVFAAQLQYEGGLQTASGLDNFINVSCNIHQLGCNC